MGREVKGRASSLPFVLPVISHISLLKCEYQLIPNQRNRHEYLGTIVSCHRQLFNGENNPFQQYEVTTMRTQRPRSLIRQDGYDLAFCHLKFRKALSCYVNKRRDEGVRITQTELCQALADHLHLSQDSINNYRKGHNGPASIEVVRNMAEYLEVEWTELMKEVTPMADKKMIEMEKKIEKNTGRKAIRQEEQPLPAESILAENNMDAPLTEFEKASAWNAVRDVYKSLLVFVSFFEGDYSVVLDLDDTSSDPVIRSYNYCWKVLHRNMLDIPDQTYEKLNQLIKELGYWIYDIPEPFENDFVTVDSGIRMDYFANLFVLELSDEMEVEESEWAERVTSWLVEDFYDSVRQILKEFIPREPAAGMGCPQVEPAYKME